MKPALLAVLFCVACWGQTPTSSACLTPAVKPDDPFSFTMSVLESLSYARSAFRATTLPPNSDTLTQVSDLIFRIKAADLDYGCAAEVLRGYQKSKEPSVSLSALNSVLVYESVIALDKETVALLKRLADDGAEKISPGDLAEKMADIRLRKEESWNGISLVLVAVTQTLVSKIPDGNGKISSLRITTQQRKTITQKLEDNFGPAVKSPVKDDEQDTILATAVEIYHWITDQGWKSTDAR